MMRSRLVTITAMLAVAGAAAGVGVATAATAASRAGTTHTIQFVGDQLKDVMVNDTDVATDKDTHNGKTVGYDVTSCTINITTHKGTCSYAVARAQGVLYGTAHLDLDTGTGSGTVNGGTKSFQGATGTITISQGASQNASKITIKYQV